MRKHLTSWWSDIAFKPSEDIKNEISYLQSQFPDEPKDLVAYFNSTYVSDNSNSMVYRRETVYIVQPMLCYVLIIQ